MANNVETYQHIADILSFDYSVAQLEENLKTSDINWDAIVIEGSKHLVLPALYCRLQSKKLLPYLPYELQNYLEELTAINRNRNASILKQATTISTLLKTHKINHVFLKGTALLASGYYADNAERMVGDIDILIDSDVLDDAFNLLLENGYNETPATLGNTFFEHKHLPRLMPKEAICAVELHKQLFTNYTYDLLSAEHILKEKCTKGAIHIPSNPALLLHTILNFQINDYGQLYNGISFRAAYDTVVLLKFIKDQRFYKIMKTSPFINYFRYLSLFFQDIRSTLDVKPNKSTYFFLFKLKNERFHRFWNASLKNVSLLKIMMHRFYIFIINRNYRSAIIKDRKRVTKHLKSNITSGK